MGSQRHCRCAVLTPALVTEPSGKLGAGGCVLTGCLLTGCRMRSCGNGGLLMASSTQSTFLTDKFPVCPESAHSEEGEIWHPPWMQPPAVTLFLDLTLDLPPLCPHLPGCVLHYVNVYIAFHLMQQLNVLLPLLPLRKIP